VDVGSPYGAGFGFGTPGPAPRSAKKWARSAHLHEVRSKSGKQRRGEEERAMRERGRPRDKENEVIDVFSSPVAVQGDYTSEMGSHLKGKIPETPSPLGFSRQSDGDDSASASGDHWVDTDVDGSGTESEFALGSPDVSVEARQSEVSP
jgi:hypothetical protein